MSKRTFNDGTPKKGEQDPRLNRSVAARIIVSILVAIALWVYVDVDRAPESTRTIRDIQVEFSGENTTLAEKNLMLLSGYDTTIDLKIRGPKRELVKMDRNNVRIIASTSSIDSVGVHQLDYTVSFPDGVVRTNVSVEKASLSQITVTVGELYTKEIPVECEIVGEVAEGYFTGETVLDPEVLTLRAQRDDLLNISCAKLTVDISGATRSVVQTVDVQLYDYNGNPVENGNIRTNASLIQAKVPVLTTKEVELAMEFEGVPGAAMNSISCEITPKTVRLNGEADVLASIDKLVLATLHVDDLALHQQSSYVVTPPDGTWLVNGNEVAAVEITLEGISETVVTVNEAVFDKLPNGMYAAMPSGGLSVRLWGLSEEIEEITEENLRVTADMSAVTGPGTITVPVTVKNTGSVAGKDVVQLYASAPYTLGGIEKAHKVLVGFAKTKLLQPGESETVTVSFDPYSAASYDYRDANSNGFSGYELEAGEYTLYVSRNAHESEKAIALKLAADVQIDTDPTTDSEVVNRYTDSEDFLDSDWQLDTMLSRADWEGTWPTPQTAQQHAGTDRLYEEIRSEEHNNPTDFDSEEYPWFGEEPTLTLCDLLPSAEAEGYEPVVSYDDERWEELMMGCDEEEMIALINNGAYHTLAMESVGLPATIHGDGPSGFTCFMSKEQVNGTCQYVSEPVMASTWNINLMNELGEAIGEEGTIGDKATGQPYSSIYAPGVNIHRSPFGGRYSEYFSEDPFISLLRGAGFPVPRGAADGQALRRE